MRKAKTLAEARKEYRQTIKDKGGRCPCCRRWGKIHAYQVTSTHVRGMIWMLKRFRRNEWIELSKAPKWMLRAKTMSILQHWNLLERAIKQKDDDRRGSGFWRLTQTGRNFLRRHITIPKYAFIFDNTVLKFSKEHVDAVQSLGKKFSYEELMHTTYRGTK